MKKVIEAIEAHGITPDTVDVTSRRGGDTPGYVTRWKVYYRSNIDPQYGVLLAHTSAEEDLECQRKKLDEEVQNFGKLQAAGFDVPAVAGPSIEVIDHLACSKAAAAIVVEHIKGVGPYKATTQFPTICKIVAGEPPALKLAHLDAWATLTMAAAKTAPMDLQVMIADSGRIVTIDAEKVGPSLVLQPI